MCVWTEIHMPLLAAICAVALACSTCHALPVGMTSSSWRHLLLFRSRSRHTYGFLPEAQFDLPHLELQSLLAEHSLTLQKSRDANLYWAEGVEKNQLVAAVAKSILTHSLFSIVASAPTPAAACTAAATQINGLALSDMEVIDLENPMIRTTDRTRLLAECQQAVSVGSRSSDSCCDHLDEHQQWVMIREHDGIHATVHVGVRLQMGPAGGRGAPGRTPRRCYRGLLGTYALKSRAHTTPVTMEPELAFLMANLAKVGSPGRSSTAVLDPCCGSGGLLLCAAALGASELVGVDSDESAFAYAASEFAAHGLPAPKFRRGDVLAAARCGDESVDGSVSVQQGGSSSGPDEASRARDEGNGSLEGLFDAILCDPPYGMSASAIIEPESNRDTSAIIGPRSSRDGSMGRSNGVGGDQGDRSADNGDSGDGGGDGDGSVRSSGWARGADELTTGRVDRLFASALISLAARHLRPGGRLVFFLPVRGSDAEQPLEEVLASVAPDGMLTSCAGNEGRTTPPLVLLPGRQQRFSRTFARWLVCIERADDATSLSPGPASVASASEKPEAADIAAAEPVRDQPSAQVVTAPNAPLTARAKAGSVLRPRAAVSAIRCCSSPSDPPSSPSAQPPRRRGSRTGAWTEAQQRAYNAAVSQRVRSRGGHGGDGLAVEVPAAYQGEDGATLDPEAVDAFADLAAADDRRRAWHGEVASATSASPATLPSSPSSASASPTPTASSPSQAVADVKPRHSKRASQHVCRVCSLTFDRRKQLDEHLRGKRHAEAVAAAQEHWVAFKEGSSWWHEPSLSHSEQKVIVTSAWSLDAFLEGLPSRSRDSGSGLAPHVTLASLAPTKRLMIWRYLRELTPSNPILPEVFAQLEKMGDGRFARVKEILESGETFRHAEQAILRSDPTAVVKRGKVPVTPRAGRTYRPEIRRVVDVACGHGLVGLLLAHRFPTELEVDAIDWVQRAAFAAYQAAWSAAAATTAAASVEIDMTDGTAEPTENDTAEVMENGTEKYALKQPMPPLRNIRFVEGDFTTSVAADADADADAGGTVVAPVNGQTLILCVHGCNEVNVQAVDLAKRADAAWLAVPCCLKAELYMPDATSLRLPDDTRYAFLCGSMAASYGADRVAALDARITPRAIVLSGGGPEAARAASNEIKREQDGARAAQAAQLTARGRVSNLPSGGVA